MPFMNWVKTPDGYKPVEITDEEMVAQNTVKRAEREKMERIREQLEVGDMEREKMEFDKSRVFSSVNADELRAGDKVIVGSSLLELKTNVECNRRCGNIVEIGGECSNRRFTVDDVDGRGETYWELAYLVERKENCANCSHSCKSINPCLRYEPKTDTPELISLGNGQYVERKHYRPFRDTDELIKVFCEKTPKIYDKDDEKLFMPYIWVREKGCNKSAGLITCYGSKGITVRGKGMYFDTLFTMFEFLDGSPCGVEE